MEYTEKELKKIRQSLPKNGYKLVSDKLEGISPDSVRMILHEPSRYNEMVFDAVALVLEERKQKIIAQKQRIKQAI